MKLGESTLLDVADDEVNPGGSGMEAGFARVKGGLARSRTHCGGGGGCMSSDILGSGQWSSDA